MRLDQRTQVLVEVRFGSHLYGTDTDQSDEDWKGIYLPELEEVLLGRVRKSIRLQTKSGSDDKNSPEDVDREFYSPGYFIELLCKGETAALDMIHAPIGKCREIPNKFWTRLLARRELAYSKNMRSFVGYARRQAAKYGVKGSRLAEAERMRETLLERDPEQRFGELWKLPEFQDPVWNHGSFYTNEAKDEFFELCGIKLQRTAKVSTVLEVVENFILKYGARARAARDNEGVDWKAISHAFRAAFQLRTLFQNSIDREGVVGWQYPLPEAEFLRDVKSGRYPWNSISEKLDELIDDVEELSDRSPLRARVDRESWDHWLTLQLAELYGIDLPELR